MQGEVRHVLSALREEVEARKEPGRSLALTRVSTTALMRK
jgi:hypothetical protein